MAVAIKVENLSKLYRLGEIGTGTISRDLQRWWATSVMGKEDPFLKIGQTNNRATKGGSDIVYSLQDLNFEINQGDAVGIIGKNGAGKSTLLKLLSRVTSPSNGSIKIKGRVASLLEVGTGFHPELTGKENIYLNGAILGMRKKEISRKLDEIIDFSGVERYIDTPVKRYSSGMYVRLAFAVAAHLESEILIVDEVLAVGDAEFQKKCLGKMGEVSRGEGRTVLFVSHNMASVKSICEKGILLTNGMIDYDGDVNFAIKRYLGAESEFHNYKRMDHVKNGFTVLNYGIRNISSDYTAPIIRDQEIVFEMNYNNQTNQEGIFFNLKMKDDEGKYFLVTASAHETQLIEKGIGKAIMHIPAGFLNEGSFSIDLMVLSKDEKGYTNFYTDRDVLTIQVIPEQKELGSWMGKEEGYIIPNFKWTKNDTGN